MKPPDLLLRDHRDRAINQISDCPDSRNSNHGSNRLLPS